MGFFKSLFGSAVENPEEKRQEELAKKFDVLKYDGVRALRSGQMAYAKQCFTHALEIKDDLEVRDYLSEALMRSGEMLPALEQLRLLCEAQPYNGRIYVRMAQAAYMLEDYTAMAQACEKALAIDAEDILALYLYARAYRGQHNPILAVAMLTKAIALDEHYGDAYLLRGEILLEMGDVEGAAQDADLLLERNPGHEDVLMLKARVAEAAGRHDEALALYGQVIDANPFCTVAYKERGAIRYATGDKEGASEDMRQLLELEPGMADSLTGQYQAEGKD